MIFGLLLAVLPIFLLVVLGTAVVCRIRKTPMPRALCWPDALTLLLIPIVWSAFEHVGAPKSLANLVELIVLGWFWCLCLLVRYILAAKGKLRSPRTAAWLTLVVVLFAAILSAIFFPCLPE